MKNDSVKGLTVPYSNDVNSVGYLSAVPSNINEECLLPQQRIPRFTTGYYDCVHDHITDTFSNIHVQIFLTIFFYQYLSYPV